MWQSHGFERGFGLERNVATAQHRGEDRYDYLSPTSQPITNRNLLKKLRNPKQLKSRSPNAGGKLAALQTSSNERLKTVAVAPRKTSSTTAQYQQLSAIGDIFHKDAIIKLQTQVKLLRLELANKSRFIDGMIQAGIAQDEISGKRAIDIHKLKDELSAAFRTIAQRDIEINRLKSSKKVKSFN